jgi:hypothetical protein
MKKKLPRPPWYHHNPDQHKKNRAKWLLEQLEPPQWRDLDDDQYLQLRLQRDDIWQRDVTENIGA